MTPMRTTVYLNPKLYRAAKVKSAVTSKSLSDIVNAALVESLREDEADLAAFAERKREPSRPFEAVLRDLRRDGVL
jgi:hypothetical protein